MSEQFKVGEIVVGQNFIFETRLNGMEAEIVGGLKSRAGVCTATGSIIDSMSYMVQWANGEMSQQEPPYLRRREPPTAGEQSILSLLKGVPQRDPVPA